MSARTTLRVLHRRLLSACARDITAETASRSAVVLAPHADDETIGCGATIARKIAGGAAVSVVVVADGGDERRRAEATEAMRRLGLGPAQLHFLGMADGGLDRSPVTLDRSLRAVLDEDPAEEVYAPCAIDAHRDHRALAAAAERLRDGALPDARLLSYPVWFWNRWAWVDPSMPRRTQRARLAWEPAAAVFGLHPRIVRTGGFLPHKRRALAAHESQVAVLDPAWVDLFLGPDEVFFDGR